MKVLHLSKDPSFTRVLRDAVGAEGCDLRSAGNWHDLFALLPDGPFGAAVLAFVRMTKVDRQHALNLAGATGGRAPIHLITHDVAGTHALQLARPDLFRVAPPTLESALVILAPRNAPGERPSDNGAYGAWEQICPDIRLRKLPGRWLVQRAGYPPADLTKHEAGMLAMLLAAAGRPVSIADLARCLYDDRSSQARNALQITICRLREKLGEDGVHPCHLLTLPSFGYLWRS